MMTWNEVPDGEIEPIELGGWLRAVLRGVPLFVLVFGGLLLLLFLRLIERPFCGLHRPVTPFITQIVCRNALRLLGFRFKSSGVPMTEMGGLVANHSSWLDIFALNACGRPYFVSKAEVAAWPGIGWLARATGTVFIRRNPRDAEKQRHVFAARLRAGHKLLFFPEGTSSDGRRVLPFKSTLFAAFFTEELRPDIHIQPVSLRYTAPEGTSERFYGWWGDMEFAPHLLQTLAARKQGQIDVIYHTPLKVSEFPDRKALARRAEDAVRAGVSAEAL